MKAVPANRYLIFLSIAVAGCLIDLATKSWIFGHPEMSDGRTWWIWQDVFGFKTDTNTGALFGMGKGMSLVFAALSLVAAAGIVVWLFYAGAARDRLLTVALGCVMAGILGNLYDRLGMHGLRSGSGEPVRAVRDWILVMIGDWPWPTFNLADSLLVGGAALLVWHALRAKPAGEEEPGEPGRQPPETAGQ